MKAVIQRVNKASCTVNGDITGSIEKGLLVYFGVDKGDDASLLPRFLDKIKRKTFSMCKKEQPRHI